MATEDDPALRPRCVATTGRHVRTNGRGEDRERQSTGGGSNNSSLFSQAQFSGDGTTIITQNADYTIRTYLLPSDLLDETSHPNELSAHSTLRYPSAVQSYALYPHFNLDDTSTTAFLYASNDLPISLTNALDSATVHATYPYINPNTEAFIAPKSLAWTRDGSRFIAGSRNQISIFDVQRNGEGPITTHKVGTSRKQQQLYGEAPGCQGITTALSISVDGMLAAGTTERQIGLHANEGSGAHVTSFSLAPTIAGDGNTRKGSGITQLAWSPDGKYLLAAERQSDGIYVYDVRHALRCVSFLTGRKARTLQRLGMDVVPTADGYEVWAGGTDGCVRMWKNPGSIGDEQIPDAEMKVHGDAVSSAVWHPEGAVLATCSGRLDRGPLGLKLGKWEDDVEDEMPADNTLKIWTV